MSKLYNAIIFSLSSLCLFVPTDMFAQSSPAAIPASCDAEFMDVIRSRSWIEAKREVEMAQVLIRKPDSVLEYSCFDRRLTQMGNAATNLFSDNVTGTQIFKNESFAPADMYQPSFSSPAGPIGMSGEPAIENGSDLGASTTAALQNVVRNALGEYLSKNFGHSALGGLMSGGGGGSDCDFMYRVWDFAKCSDFDKSYIPSLEDIAATDFRDMPSSCSEGTRAARWAAALVAAKTDPASPPVNGGSDVLETHMDVLNTDGACAPPTRTGLSVKDLDGSLKPEAVCRTPGCWYNSDSEKCQR